MLDIYRQEWSFLSDFLGKAAIHVKKHMFNCNSCMPVFTKKVINVIKNFFVVSTSKSKEQEKMRLQGTLLNLSIKQLKKLSL